MSLLELIQGKITSEEFNNSILKTKEKREEVKDKLFKQFAYAHKKVVYIVQLVTINYDVKVLGILTPKEPLACFTKKFDILPVACQLKVKPEELTNLSGPTSIVRDTKGYIAYQIYLHEKLNNIEEAKQWKEYLRLFLPRATQGGTA